MIEFAFWSVLFVIIVGTLLLCIACAFSSFRTRGRDGLVFPIAFVLIGLWAAIVAVAIGSEAIGYWPIS